MIWLYAFLIGSTGLGFDPIYGAGVSGDWRPQDRMRLVASVDWADSKKQYLDSGWSTQLNLSAEYATNGPLLGLEASWSHNQTKTYTKDAFSPIAKIGMTLEPGSRLYLEYSPNDFTDNEVKALGFRWEYEQRRWSLAAFGGMEEFKDQQRVKRNGAFYAIRLARKLR